MGLALVIPSAIAFLWSICMYIVRRKRGLSLPPGPKKSFLIGNLLNMPRANEWEVYDKWSKELGASFCISSGVLPFFKAEIYPWPDTDILHLDVAGTSIIVIGSHEAAIELFERRSSIHSGRSVVWCLDNLRV